MKIVIETIPHDQQRYPTVGDWTFDTQGNLLIRVSELGDWRHEALVAIHELIEVLLCKRSGVTQEVVDQFDLQYEKARVSGQQDEPGDEPSAPYKVQHCIATGIERILAAELGVDWKMYEQAVQRL